MGDAHGRGEIEPPLPTTTEKLERLKAAIWSRRPILGEIMQKYGKEILYRYAQNFMSVNRTPGLDGRKAELVNVAEELISRRLGPDVARGVARQLTKLPLVSTTDHHGPIDHPFFVNANIITALPYHEYRDPLLQYLVVFSFATVSVNNASAYPRGIIFHGGVDGSENLIRLPFIPDKLKMGVVYGVRPFTQEDFDRAKSDLAKKVAAKQVVPERAEKVRSLIDQYFATPEVLNAPDLCSQISIINYRMWPNLFHSSQQQDRPKVKAPDLIYLDIETLVRELLLRHHLESPTSPFYRLLFDPEMRAQALQQFNNIQGGFSVEKGWGTYLFWAVNEKQHRVGLTVSGHRLVAERDGSRPALPSAVADPPAWLPSGMSGVVADGYSVTLSPDAIRDALLQKKIFPSMLLCYLMVSQYYGMKCLGGFSQVHDLTLTKEAWQRMLRAMGNEAEAQAVGPVQTKELGGDGLVLSYFRTLTGSLVPATGIDMLLDERDTAFTKYVTLAQRVTLNEMMNPMLPEMYSVLFPVTERTPELVSTSPEEILYATGLGKTLGAVEQKQEEPVRELPGVFRTPEPVRVRAA